jgi:hypothetical protein
MVRAAKPGACQPRSPRQTWRVPAAGSTPTSRVPTAASTPDLVRAAPSIKSRGCESLRRGRRRSASDQLRDPRSVDSRTFRRAPAAPAYGPTWPDLAAVSSTGGYKPGGAGPKRHGTGSRRTEPGLRRSEPGPRRTEPGPRRSEPGPEAHGAGPEPRAGVGAALERASVVHLERSIGDLDEDPVALDDHVINGQRQLRRWIERLAAVKLET